MCVGSRAFLAVGWHMCVGSRAPEQNSSGKCPSCAQLLNLDALVTRHTAFDLGLCASCHHTLTGQEQLVRKPFSAKRTPLATIFSTSDFVSNANHQPQPTLEGDRRQ